MKQINDRDAMINSLSITNIVESLLFHEEVRTLIQEHKIPKAVVRDVVLYTNGVRLSQRRAGPNKNIFDRNVLDKVWLYGGFSKW